MDTEKCVDSVECMFKFPVGDTAVNARSSLLMCRSPPEIKTDRKEATEFTTSFSYILHVGVLVVPFVWLA